MIGDTIVKGTCKLACAETRVKPFTEMTMPISTRIAEIAAAAVFLLAPAAAHAQITVFNTLADYLNAVSPFATDTYNELAPNIELANSVNRTAGLFSYAASTVDPMSVLFSAGTNSDPWLSTRLADDVLLVNNFSSNVRGVGGFFFTTDIDGAAQPGSITITVTDALGSAIRIIDLSTPQSFLGFVTTGPSQLFSVRLTAGGTIDLARWPTVNNLVLGGIPAQVTTIPEPHTLLLLLSGVAVLVLVRRGRRAPLGVLHQRQGDNDVGTGR